MEFATKLNLFKYFQIPLVPQRSLDTLRVKQLDWDKQLPWFVQLLVETHWLRSPGTGMESR